MPEEEGFSEVGAVVSLEGLDETISGMERYNAGVEGMAKETGKQAAQMSAHWDRLSKGTRQSIEGTADAVKKGEGVLGPMPESYRRMQSELSDMGERASEAEKQVDQLHSTVAGGAAATTAGGSGMIVFAAGITIAIAAVATLIGIAKAAYGALDALSLAVIAHHERFRQALALQDLAAEAGISSAAIVQGARKAARGWVSQERIISAASKELLEGHKELARAIPRLMETAYEKAPALSKSVEASFESLVGAIRKGNAEAMREFGMFDVATAALEAYAEENYTTVDALTALEREHIILNAVLVETSGLMLDLGTAAETQAQQFQEAKRSVSEFWQLLLAAVGREVFKWEGFELLGDVVDQERILAEFLRLKDEMMRILQAAAEQMPDWDIGLEAEVEGAIADFERLMYSGASLEVVAEGLVVLGDRVAEFRGRANVEFMLMQFEELRGEIAETHDPMSTAATDAHAIAVGIVAIMAAIRGLDPSAIDALTAALGRLREIAGVGAVGMPGFAKLTAVEQEIRRQEEMERLTKKARGAALGLAPYLTFEETEAVFGKMLANAEEWVEEWWPNIAGPEAQYELTKMNQGWRDLRAELAKVNREGRSGVSWLKQMAEMRLGKGPIGEWAIASTAEHGGRTPFEQYERHEEPLVAAMMDKMEHERVMRETGRPMTRGQEEAFWFKVHQPFEVFQGGPIVGQKGPEYEAAKAELAGLGIEEIGKFYHSEWMARKGVLTSLEEIKTQEGILASFLADTGIPAREDEVVAVEAVIKTSEDFVDSVEAAIARIYGLIPPEKNGDENGDEGEGVVLPPTKSLLDKTYFPYVEEEEKPWAGGPLQFGGVTTHKQTAVLHGDEGVIPFGSPGVAAAILSQMLGRVGVNVGPAGRMGGGGVSIGEISVPITVGGNVTRQTAAMLQTAVVEGIRHRAGAAMRREARRLGL